MQKALGEIRGLLHKNLHQMRKFVYLCGAINI